MNHAGIRNLIKAQVIQQFPRERTLDQGSASSATQSSELLSSQNPHLQIPIVLGNSGLTSGSINRANAPVGRESITSQICAAPGPVKTASPYRYLNSSPEIIRLAVMMYERFPLRLRTVEDMLFKRGIDICHETVRFWWSRFGPMFASEVWCQRVSRMCGIRHRCWHLDEVFVKINREQHCLWHALDHEDEILESYETKIQIKLMFWHF